MNRLLALLLFVPSLCIAQVPTYVPTDGLIAWYPLNGDANDVSGNDLDLSLSGQVSHQDQSETPNQALLFSGQPIIATQPELNLTGYVSFTISVWLVKASNDEFYAIIGNSEGAGETNKGILQFGWGQPNTYSWHVNAPGQPGFGNFSSGFSPAMDEWHHITYVKDSLDYAIYINGEASGAGSYLYEQNLASSSTYIGNAQDCCNLGFHGAMDNLGLWSRALDATEVMSLFIEALPNSGCTDQEACNFQPDANVDDGSCVTCEVLAAACGEGTVWDSTLQECVTDMTFPTAPCGEGTIWDPVNEECIIAIPADLNYDGCVTVADLLELLAVHGTCPPLPEWPEEPTDTTWACGDPLTYWDYDYATVLIGDQCWFAENLRTASYLNGDDIPEPSNQDEWATLLLGMTTVYGSDEHICYSAWNFDACDDSLALEEFGRLYNWWAVDASRGLCPTEWHVASNQEWFDLENHAAQNGFNGIEAIALQSTSGWGVTGNGTDDFGFAAKPGGHCDFGGTYFYAGNRGKWWTSTYENGNGRYWYSTHMDPEIHSAVDTPKYGFSVRCIKD